MKFPTEWKHKKKRFQATNQMNTSINIYLSHDGLMYSTFWTCFFIVEIATFTPKSTFNVNPGSRNPGWIMWCFPQCFWFLYWNDIPGVDIIPAWTFMNINSSMYAISINKNTTKSPKSLSMGWNLLCTILQHYVSRFLLGIDKNQSPYTPHLSHYICIYGFPDPVLMEKSGSTSQV